MRSKCRLAALAAGFALAGAPALAAIRCVDPGPPPPPASFPDRPALPSGVEPDIVVRCAISTSPTSRPAECLNPPGSTYLEALHSWTAQAEALRKQVEDWHVSADRYADCFVAAIVQAERPPGARN